jgi:hypothetical protein
MKIYNYSDSPVTVDGKEIDAIEINLPTNFDRNIVTHNGSTFLKNSNIANSNVCYFITNHRSGNPNHYRIKEEIYDVPNVWMWSGIYLTFFSFFLMIRVFQKIKSR